MIQYSLKNILVSLIILTGILQGCTSKEGKIGAENSQEIKVHTIDLFPQEGMIYDNTGKLSFDEAFQLSKEVLYVASIEKVDSSQTRGIKPFYIYKAAEGRFEKSVDTQKNKLLVLFLSEKNLFQGRILNDSMYLFLEPLQQYELLRKGLGIKYKWVNNAPFVKH
jgi:hypothetical protein